MFTGLLAFLALQGQPIPSAVVAQERSGPPQAPYARLDNIEGPWIQLNPVPIRPLVVLPGEPFAFAAVNTHASTVELFESGSPTPTSIRPVGWGPVSIGYWQDPSDDHEELLVVCRGSHVLLRTDLASGRILESIPLPHEPADLLVVPAADRAFIACSGAEVVVQLDLLTGNRVEYSEASHPNLRVTDPMFLALDMGGGTLVIPQLSGNNSTSSRKLLRVAGETVLDLADPTVAVQGLPDEDLFRIEANSQTVTPLSLGMGTVLFHGGINPITGQFWQLGTEALNKDPERQTEPSVRGRFVRNRLVINRPSLAQPPPGPEKIVELDDVDPNTPGVQHDPGRAVGQPQGLSFRSDGHGVFVGALTDNVVHYDDQGDFVEEWDLPEGSIPRFALVAEPDGAEDRVLVYCWGTNEVRTYRMSDLALLEVHALGPDPAPANVQRGRELFYDGGNSLHGNASCASCHVEGKTDLLVWNLSQKGADSKGPLATQSMAGLERLAPFHWRGEREDLLAFNQAFPGLMGGRELDAQEFADFTAFVMSLRVPASPHQNRERVVDDAIVPPGLPPGTSATTGQTLYFNFPTFTGATCHECHALPTGTNQVVFTGELLEDKPKRNRFKVAAFPAIWRKNMSGVDVELFVDPSDPGQGTFMDRRAYLGAGLTHSGLIENLATRIDDFFGQSGGSQEGRDTAAYLLQLDGGLAPAVHAAFLLDGADPTAGGELAGYLLPQADLRHCDVVATGTAVGGGGPQPARWAYDRITQTFRANDPALADRTLADFTSAAGSGESHLFLGLPVGMGRAFAIDRDLDGLLDAVDPAPDVAFVDSGDTTAPVFTTAPHSPWASAKSARVTFSTSEPTVWRVRVTGIDGVERLQPRHGHSEAFAHDHAILVEDLLPSTAVTNAFYTALDQRYDIVVEVQDRAGNVASASVSTIQTLPFGPGVPEEAVVGDLHWRRFVDDAPTGEVEAHVRGRIDRKRGGPPAIPAAHQLVVTRVLVDGKVREDFEALPGSFRADRIRAVSPGAQLDLGLEGPFLVGLPTGSAGLVDLGLRLPQVEHGARVSVHVEMIFQVPPADVAGLLTSLAQVQACSANGGPFNGDCDALLDLDCCLLNVPTFFAGRSLFQFAFPSTPERFRSVQAVVDPGRGTPIPLPEEF